jgi:hypothetical protein
VIHCAAVSRCLAGEQQAGDTSQELIDANRQLRHMRPRHGQLGLTAYQLLADILLIEIVASLWLAFTKPQVIKQQQQQSAALQRRHG